MIMTLDEWINAGNEWPKESEGFRLRGGRCVWTTAHYPDGSDGNNVQLSRIVTENGQTFSRVSYADRDTEIQFVMRTNER